MDTAANFSARRLRFPTQLRTQCGKSVQKINELMRDRRAIFRKLETFSPSLSLSPSLLFYRNDHFEAFQGFSIRTRVSFIRLFNSASFLSFFYEYERVILNCRMKFKEY